MATAIDLDAAETFVFTHARLLERQRLAVLLHGGSLEGIWSALAGYQNDDGGFGHALEPDVRGPNSETTSTLTALELLDAYGALDHQLAARALDWVGSVSLKDGGVPFMLEASTRFPRAPWMQASAEGSHLTYGFAAAARRAGYSAAWVTAAESWCWDQLQQPEQVGGVLLKYALTFLDVHHDDARAAAALEVFRGTIDGDGCVPVPGGTEDEKLTPMALSPYPDRPSRSIFTDAQIETDLDRLAADQQADGGWTFDWAQWCPAQGLDWRGIQTVAALWTLREHHRS